MNPKLWVLRFEGINAQGQQFYADVSLDLIGDMVKTGADVNRMLLAELEGYAPISIKPIAILYIEA